MLVLSACGAGNVDNSQEPAAGSASGNNATTLASRSWSTFGPFDDWAEQATGRYSGATDQAVLNNATSGLFLDAVMQGAFPAESGVTDSNALDVRNVLDSIPLLSTSNYGWAADNLPSPGAHACETDGNMHVEIASTTEAGMRQSVVLIEYDQCEQNEHSIDGTLAMAWQGDMPNPQNLAYAFDQIEMTLYTRRIAVSGVQRQSFQCDDQFQIDTTLLLGELDSDRQMLFENLTRKSSRSNALECDYHDVVLWDEIGGAVFDSALGSVTVSTTEPLRFTHDPFSLFVDKTRFDAINIEKSYGLVELRGSENSLADLADDDDDGLPNSWERTNGLDPSDASDATSDSDSDGWNALQEYAALGDPAEFSYENLTIDQSISVELANEVDVETGATSVKVQVSGSRAVYDPDPKDQTYLLTLGAGASWDTGRLPDACMPEENTSNLACSYEYRDSQWEAGSEVPSVIWNCVPTAHRCWPSTMKT